MWPTGRSLETLELRDENGQMDNPAKTQKITLHSNISARELDSTLPDKHRAETAMPCRSNDVRKVTSPQALWPLGST
jgi:hypothetical protein